MYFWCEMRARRMKQLLLALHSDSRPMTVVYRTDICLSVALLRSTRHVNCYSYHACTSVTISGRGRNAIVHDPKPLTQNRLLLNTCMDANMQLTINNFRQFSITRFFSLTIPWLLVKSWHFPDSCQIPWHFQVFQTSGHPGCQILWPKCTKFDFGWGPRPRWWSLQCFPVEVVAKGQSPRMWPPLTTLFLHIFLSKPWHVCNLSEE